MNSISVNIGTGIFTIGLLSIFAAFLMDILAGDPYWFPHPVRFIGRFINILESLVRGVTSSPKGLKLGGVFLTIATVACTYGITIGMLFIAAKINIWLCIALNILLLYTCLATRCLGDEGIKIYKVVTKGDIAEARKQIGYLVGRETDRLEEGDITRAAVETVAENTSDGIIAPLIYMFIGGAPLAMAYKAINTMDSMIGYKNEKYLHLGWASARLDDLANYIPARITGLFMVVAAFLLKLDGAAGFKIMLRDRKNHSSPNCGYPEAAAAGALGVQLGGTNIYFGRAVYKPTLGDKLKELKKEDIIASVRLMYGTAAVALTIFTAIYLIWEKFI